jgi:undecaprenyl-diphosphatase
MDLQIAEFLNKLGAGTFIDTLTDYISYRPFLWILWVVVAILIFFLEKKRGPKIIMAMAMAIILHFLITELFFKHLLGYFMELRIRPYIAHPDLMVKIGQEQLSDGSFPSSHMASTAAILTVLVYYYKKIWPVAALFIIAMAFARIHNGMHYPTDVLTGTIFGIVFGVAAIYLSKKFSKK